MPGSARSMPKGHDARDLHRAGRPFKHFSVVFKPRAITIDRVWREAGDCVTAWVKDEPIVDAMVLAAELLALARLAGLVRFDVTHQKGLLTLSVAEQRTSRWRGDHRGFRPRGSSLRAGQPTRAQLGNRARPPRGEAPLVLTGDPRTWATQAMVRSAAYPPG